jgi:hypothetical protein
VYWQVAVFGALVSEEQGAQYGANRFKTTGVETLIEEDDVGGIYR